MLVKVLSTGAIVLGLYVLINMLFLNPRKYGFFDLGPQPSYHVGCFDMNAPINSSLELSEALKRIEQKFTASLKLNMYNMAEGKAMSPYFDENVREVAKTFEHFIDEYNHQKIKTQQDLHFYNTLSMTKKSITECSKLIGKTFNETECENSWNRYLNASQTFGDLKEKLKKKLDYKEKQENLVQAYLEGYEGDDIEDIEVKLDEQIKKITREQVDLEGKILEGQNKRVKIMGKLMVVQDDIRGLKALLKQCEDNSRVIDFCKGITDDLKTVKKSINQQKLHEALGRKRKIIEAELNTLRKAKKRNDSRLISQTENSYAVHHAALRALEAQIAQLNEEEELCKQCSQVKMQELRKNITDLEADQKRYKEQSYELTTNIIQFQQEVQAKESDKKEKEEDFQKAQMISGYKGCQDEQCEKQQQEFVRKTRSQLATLNKEIVQLQTEFGDRSKQNLEYVEEMGLYIKGIDEISDCLRRKSLYEELISHAPDQTDQQGQQKIQEARDTLKKQLHDFDL